MPTNSNFLIPKVECEIFRNQSIVDDGRAPYIYMFSVKPEQKQEKDYLSLCAKEVLEKAKGVVSLNGISYSKIYFEENNPYSIIVVLYNRVPMAASAPIEDSISNEEQSLYSTEPPLSETELEELEFIKLQEDNELLFDSMVAAAQLQSELDADSFLYEQEPPNGDF